MRKLLIVSLLTILLSLNLIAQISPTATSFSIHGGYSWLNGVVGAELQSGCIGISAGWMPTSMPMSGNKVNSFSGALTVYGGQPTEPLLCYLSGGIASAGYQYEDSYGYGKTDQVIIFMAGLKFKLGTFYGKLGAGYGFCSEADSFTLEGLIGIPLFKNYDK
jgi:hypothetical protein